MKRVIIDTDPGVDDALALMLAINSSELDILAITTVMGNSSIENTTRNAKWVLDKLGNNKIPIYSGSDISLNGKFSKSFVMGESGLGGVILQKRTVLSNNAVEKILEIIQQNPGEVSLVAIGPLTNIARAIRKNSQIMEKLKEIIIMGGAINVPGNINRVAEFNFFNDPLAAEIVFDFPIKKVIVPLDLCNKVELSSEDFDKISGELKKPILQMIGDYISKLEIDETGKRVALVYDALAVYYLLNPAIYKTQKMDIKIETNGKLTRGMSVADLRMTSIKKNNVLVALGIDKKVFVGDFIKILSKEIYLNKQNDIKTKELK